MSLADALLNYTHLYLRFNLGRDFDAQHPVWQDYLRGLDQADDLVEWTYQIYLRQLPPDDTTQTASDRTFGCFSYGVWAEGQIRLHFHNDDPPGFGPLSKARMPNRLHELRQLFAHVQTHVKNPTSVVGGSWLYNLNAYRRLFPPAFLATASVGDDDWQFLALWGQFVDRNGDVKHEMSEPFLKCLDAQTTLDGVKRCFLYQVLRLECPVEPFYELYQI